MQLAIISGRGSSPPAQLGFASIPVWGLGVVDIGKIAFVTGNGFVLEAAMTPGSLGVIEILISLPQFQKEELLATRIMFRSLYFMLALSIAALLLGGREISLLAKFFRCPGGGQPRGTNLPFGSVDQWLGPGLSKGEFATTIVAIDRDLCGNDGNNQQ